MLLLSFCHCFVCLVALFCALRTLMMFGFVQEEGAAIRAPLFSSFKESGGCLFGFAIWESFGFLTRNGDAVASPFSSVRRTRLEV